MKKMSEGKVYKNCVHIDTHTHTHTYIYVCILSEHIYVQIIFVF